MATDERIRAVLRTQWHLPVRSCAALPGSRWRASTGEDQLLVIITPVTHDARLRAGLAVAEHLARAGFPAGAPVRAASGAFTVPVEDSALAVVHEVPGRPLDPADPVDQQWWGDLLGAAHRALTGYEQPALSRFAWLSPDAAHLAVAPWVRPAVRAAVAAVTRLTVTDRLTYGVLHGDPVPEAFRIDPGTGRSGLVEWRAPATGPLVYDLAAAVGYAGGPAAGGELVDGYLAAGPVPPDEAEVALPVLARYWLAERVDAAARQVRAADTDATRAALEASRTAWEEFG